MERKSWKKRITAALMAGIFAVGGSFALQPAPVADAGWGDLFGTVIGGFQAWHMYTYAMLVCCTH